MPTFHRPPTPSSSFKPSTTPTSVYQINFIHTQKPHCFKVHLILPPIYANFFQMSSSLLFRLFSSCYFTLHSQSIPISLDSITLRISGQNTNLCSFHYVIFSILHYFFYLRAKHSAQFRFISFPT
jgi:hypothetical protein